MAISKEEETQQGETRRALLQAIKVAAEKVAEQTGTHNAVQGEELHHLAQAYALVTGPAGTPKPAGRSASF